MNTDREVYISGEEMWFSAYLFDRQKQEPSGRSRIVYVELLNPDNRPVVQKKVGMNNGFGPGQLAIPDTLTTGNYTLRAYTSWMKNFLPVNCYVKKVRIWNALNTRRFAEKEEPAGLKNNDNNAFLNSVSADKSISISLDKTKQGMLRVTVDANSAYRSRNNSLIYIFIQTHGKADYVNAVLLSGDTTSTLVPLSYLSEGINQVTVFNLQGMPVCERYIYTPGMKEENLYTTVADSLGCRSKIDIGISLKGMVAGKYNSGLSISVSPSVAHKPGDNIENYMLLGSEFGLMDPVLYTGNNGEIDPVKLNSLLLNAHSNWIDWNRIIKFKGENLEYPFEDEFYYIYGSLIGNGRDNDKSGKFIFLSKPGKVATFKYSKTDEKGNFVFGLHIDESLKKLIIQPENAVQGQTLKIESPFSDVYLNSGVESDSANIRPPSYIAEWETSYQVRKIYSIRSTGTYLPPVTSPLTPLRFYGKPDIEINMADYIKLPVMQEVFFELVTGAFLKERNAAWEITIADPVDNIIYNKPPVLMIDGVVIKDASVIANLDPELVQKIDVVREEYMVGDYLFYGVVNIITHSGDFSNGTLPDEAVTYPYRVLDPVYSFMSPDYSSSASRNSRIPDFRTTLYWNPSVTLDKDGKADVSFWTSDLTSDYEICIQGITPDGKPITVRKKIRVRK